MKKIKLLGLVLLPAFFNSAFATNYTYQDTSYKANIDDKKVEIQECKKTDCKTYSVDKVKLIKILKAQLKDNKALLADKDSLTALVKKQMADPKTKVIDDKASKQKYVILKLSPKFTLPAPEKALKTGDFDFIFRAVDSGIDRFEQVLSIVDSGKLPKSFKTKDYNDAHEFLQFLNVVKYSKYL